MSRKQTMKVYHGIPKSITDEHTIFYASLDGTIEPEIGSVDVNTASDFISDPMGYHPISGGNMVFTATKSVDIFTIDMYIPKFPKVSSGNKAIIALKTETNSDLFYIQIPSQQDYLALVQTDNTGWHTLTKSQQDCFIRIVVNKGNVTNYINGIKISQSITIKSFTKFNKIRIMLGSSTWNGVADIHISDIDRGDYFPNLPQDFIDGKAIIKPRMGQQQIKGDPLYSQYTLLKVPNANNIDSSEFYKKDDYDYYVNIPELKTTGSYSWNAADATITIKGLNGEIISGVIDNDTALCRITAIDTTNYSIIVDSLAGLTNGDSVKVKASTGSISIVNRYVKILDVTKNLIELHSKSDLSDKISYGIEILNGYIFETTTSSSSPVVKTQDGTVVVGTWTGLGTNEATFTLGNNSNITNKDLYVEYSLNIPNNNSDFNELPYNIDKAWTENGIEITPTDKILITDDFKDKIANSTKECPHFAGFCKSNSLASPSSFIEYKFYNNIYCEDNKLVELSVTELGQIPQNIFSFNLIEMVERKIGTIPAINKVDWLRNNLDSTGVLSIYGYGINGSSNLLTLSMYDATTNSWYGSDKNNTNYSSKIQLTFTTLTDRRITDDGFLHAIAYGSASNNTTSTIYIDYISLKIKLKLDNTYIALYCNNSRAREDKCNPVLIQKETKTVKRYLPSKECFTTECKYVKMNNNLLSTSEMNNYHYKGTKVYSTTRGSGKYSKYTGICPNIINLLRIPDYKAYEYMCESLKESPVTNKENMSLTEQLGESYCRNTLSAMPTELYDVQKYIQLVPFIRLNNSEIELMLYSSELINSGKPEYPKQMTKDYVYSYKLPNRPLIK